MPRRTDVRLRFLSILLALAGLVCIAQQPQPARGQLGAPGCGATVGKLIYQPCAAPASGCAAATNWIGALSGNETPNDKSFGTTLLCTGLAGVTNLDAVYSWVIGGTSNATDVLVNMVNPGTFNGTVHGGMTFTAATGGHGNGATGYVDPVYSLQAPPGNFTQNSSAMGGCVLTSSNSSNGDLIGGSNVQTNRLVPFTTGGPGGTAWGMWDGSLHFFTSTTNIQGDWALSRTGASASSLYLNASSVDTSTNASAADNTSLFMFAQNTGNAGTQNPGSFSSFTVGVTWFGGSMSAGNITTIHSAIHTYLITNYGLTGC